MDGAALLEVNVALNITAVCVESRGWSLKRHYIDDASEDSAACATKLWPAASTCNSFEDITSLILMDMDGKAYNKFFIACCLHGDGQGDGVIEFISTVRVVMENAGIKTTSIIFAQSPSDVLVNAASDELSCVPFYIKEASVLAFGGKWAFWALDDVDWPKHTQNP